MKSLFSSSGFALCISRQSDLCSNHYLSLAKDVYSAMFVFLVVYRCLKERNEIENQGLFAWQICFVFERTVT